MKLRWFLWLQQIINPPVNKRRKRAEHHEEHQYAATNHPTQLEQVQTIKIEYKCKHTEENGTHPEKHSRAKKFGAWIQRNVFNALLTLFTAAYAVGFLFDAYVTKRAYMTPGAEDGTFISFLSGNVGIEVLFRNAGQTPVKGYSIETWLLRGGKASEIWAAPSFIPANSIAAGYPIRHYIQWTKAPQEIPQFKSGDQEVGMVGRIIYQDAFYIWHCEEFAVQYEVSPIGRFISKTPMSVCSPKTTAVRYWRVCMKEGARSWWADFWVSGTADDTNILKLTDDDPTPCVKNKK